MRSRRLRLAIAVWALVGLAAGAAQAEDRLKSWNDGPARHAIVAFVEKSTKLGPGFVPEDERIAVFDNDGTLWIEQPMYTQLAFALDRVKALAPQHPEWKTTQPFQAVLQGDTKALMASGERGLVELIMATHAGMSTAEFEKIVNEWTGSARHPKYKRPYTELVYQPMLELLDYLRHHHFKTYIVSGGGVEFMRPWTERVYGIPPEQVIGSSIQTRFQLQGTQPVLLRLPKVDFIDDKEVKPVGIDKFIGRRPVLAFGNSDGDRQMLEWTTAESGRIGLLVLHDDAEREHAYGPANGLPASSIGTFSQSLYDEAKARGWSVVSMKKDWKQVFPTAR